MTKFTVVHDDLFENLPDSWGYGPFGEYVDFQEGPGILAKDFHETGVPLLRLKSIESSTATLTGCNFLDPEKVEKKWSHFKLSIGDLLLSSSASLGRVSEVDESTAGALAYTGIIRMRPSNVSITKGFIRYFLQSRLFSHQIERSATGSVIKHFGPMHLKQMGITLPPVDDQKAIAHILGALDDKIELNQKMNHTLEEIAKAIFKSWFVDFDPVRAKAEGRPTGLPPEISDLFPDELVDSDIGEIPKGWVLKPIYDLADFINGAAYKKFEPNKERLGLPIIKIAELKSGVSKQTGFSTVEMGEKYLIRQKDILFSWSGNPDTSIDTFVWQRDDAWLNQHIFKVIPTEDVPRSFLLQLLRSKKPIFTEIARNKQTTGLGHVTVKDLKEMLVALPQLGSFNLALQSLETIQDRVFLCEQENLILSELRDTLLPKLISGELRIPDAEKFLEEAGI